MEKSQSNYLKRIYTLLIIIVIITVICLASQILFPLILAFILAVLIRPIDNFLQEKWRFPKVISIILTLTVSLLGIGLVFFLLGAQLRSFVSDLPQIEENVSKTMNQLKEWVYQHVGISYDRQEELLNDNLKNRQWFSLKSFGTITSSLMYLILVPVYAFLILLYRSLLLTFLIKLVPNTDQSNMHQMVHDIKSIVRRYILGLIFEFAAVATLMTCGFWAIGVKYALFLGLLTALLNLIPYVGIMVACALSCFMTLATSPNMEILIGVIGVTAAVQLIDNNFLLPRIVGSKVSINALASILSVIVGGVLAGVPGMFLAIPVTAIIKVVFDSVPQFEPYGYLLGDNIPKKVFWLGAKPKEKN